MLFRSPGNAPASFGTGGDTLSRQIVDNQTDINARTGYYFAKVNGLYDGQFVPQDARLSVPPGYGWIDPAYNEPFTITRGMRVAQMILAAYCRAEWQLQTSLDETARGAGGFGSTGVAA